MFFLNRCLKNCDHLSSPLEIVYLIVETKCNNCSFKWHYKDQSDSQLISAENIREPNTPYYIFLTKKLSLDYNKMYTFQAKGVYI